MNRSILFGIVSLALMFFATPTFALTATEASSSSASEQIRSSVNPQGCIWYPVIGQVCF